MLLCDTRSPGARHAIAADFYHFRRLAVRYEYHAGYHLGFLHIGCVLILLRHLWDVF
jgi:hypothetical protein